MARPWLLTLQAIRRKGITNLIRKSQRHFWEYNSIAVAFTDGFIETNLSEFTPVDARGA
jgi:hypothetical protein